MQLPDSSNIQQQWQTLLDEQLPREINHDLLVRKADDLRQQYQSAVDADESDAACYGYLSQFYQTLIEFREQYPERAYRLTPVINLTQSQMHQYLADVPRHLNIVLTDPGKSTPVADDSLLAKRLSELRPVNLDGYGQHHGGTSASGHTR